MIFPLKHHIMDGNIAYIDLPLLIFKNILKTFNVKQVFFCLIEEFFNIMKKCFNLQCHKTDANIFSYFYPKNDSRKVNNMFMLGKKKGTGFIQLKL